MHTNRIKSVPMLWKIANILICLSLFWFSTGCSPSRSISPDTSQSRVPFVPSTDALVTFRVTLPEPLLPGDSIFLTILDEVTGLGLNPKRYIMEAEDDTNYYVILPFVLGSMIQYRYQRQGSTLSQEHLPDGRPVRYRIYHVEGPGIVEDIVSRWTNTTFEGLGGELRGRITDATTGIPLPSIMVAAAGNQVYTHADGSFIMKQLSPGTHNLVAFSLDGAYHPFQQGALIQANSSTHAEITLQPSDLITVTFQVNLPDDTPPDAPVRLAGNIYQLGNSFTDLSGGISALVSRMPTLNKQQDGPYSLTLQLPSGIDFRYKYTLGDGLWNAERTDSGEFALRQIIVPEHDIQIQDTVDSWSFGVQGEIIIETQAPTSTPPQAVVYIQFDPGFGWTEPIPMWGRPAAIGSTVWNYTLSSPLDMLTNLKYRFCLEGLCNDAFALDYSGSSAQEYTVAITQESQKITNQIADWAGQPGTTTPAIIPNVPVTPRNDGFTAGIAIQDIYRPPWGTKIPLAISDIKNLHANWIFIQPTWAYTNFSPPTLEFSPSTSPNWDDLVSWIKHAHLLSLKVALFPLPEFNQISSVPSGDPYSYTNDWDIWFENYSLMVTHYALLANETGAKSLIIGANWITPPSSSNTTQSLPTDDSATWIKLITNLRSVYRGKLIWATTYSDGINTVPSILELVDEIYVLWSPPLATQPNATSRQMRDEALRLIDRDLHPFWQQTKKPIILALAYPSVTMNEQMNAYNAMMMALNDRPWLAGIVSTGYYPPLPLKDTCPSVNGKPASGVLWYWFPLFLGH